MLEERVTLDEDEIIYRDLLLRQKKRGLIIALVLMFLACGLPLWILQKQEQSDIETLLIISGALTVLLLAACLCYRIFTRQINQDLQGNENVLLPAFVVEGWQVNQRRDPILLLNIGNHLVKLPMTVIKRHVDDVRDVGQMMPGTELLVEMTPHARVIVRIMRV